MEVDNSARAPDDKMKIGKSNELLKAETTVIKAGAR
jgi:hypothetical protein